MRGLTTAWEPGYATGESTLDAQHAALLAQCNALAGRCAGADAAEAAAFDAAFERLEALAREHVAAEAERLAAAGDADAAELRDECDEFEYLAAEIATTENFDRLELQRFVALWCLGHVRDSAERYRALAAATPATLGPR